MDAIARAAGVAVGTLYRNFPTKHDLVQAVVVERAETMVGDLDATVARVRAGADVRAEIAGLAARVVESVADDAAVKAAAQRLGGADYAEPERRAYAALDCLVEIGHRDGCLRSGVTAADFGLLVTTAPADQPKAVRDRWLAIFLAGVMAP